MSDSPPDQPRKKETGFLEAVAEKTARKLKAQREGPQGVWFGLGMSGLVGWSVAVPTVAGGLIGIWIDRRHPGGHSWTLALLAAGLAIGCLNAWHWVAQQNKAMDDEPEARDE
jgi:ATP synthase protein I